MIPNFTSAGKLPKGIYKSTWDEFCIRFGTNKIRKQLLDGLKKLIIELSKAGCSAVYVDGSFVTKKELPNDYDLCWKMDKVFIERLDPILLNYTDAGKEKMMDKYLGDIRGAEFSVRETGNTYLHFFQHDRNGNAKGIIEINPLDGEYYD